ncbi:hypothetical protein CHS0354_006808 [Potamilus streckersoni]|uniref:HD domain-containing protein n=1 Tax=Potamilus streckersoni TaxID=2493646 RepID=A0AAE0TE87_9BIVA|nr:hypothetical protein CHS0354_006808 [Potamilus streckersoni]
MPKNKALPIITPYGPQVPDIYALRPCDIDTRKILDWMEKTKRFNGHSPVSLLYHTVLVMRYTAELGRWFVRGNPEHPWIKTAGVHDLHECFTGDILTPVKNTEIKALERDVFEQLMIHYGISDALVAPELPDIVKKADVLALNYEVSERQKMTRRKAVPVLAPANDREMTEILGIYAETASRLKKLEAECELKIKEIREKYADETAALKNTAEAAFKRVQLWAERSPGRFETRKSADTVYGRIGFRTGTPKIKPRRGFTFASALELVKLHLPGFVRTSEELNKELLLMKADELGADKLSEVGLEAVQEETFYIELKSEKELTAPNR